MTCLTRRTATAYCMTERQLRSVWTTRLATLRWTNISPGARPVNCVAGTRLSAQPIHRYSGDCCRDNSRKKSGSRSLIPVAHARLLSKILFSVLIFPASLTVRFFDDTGKCAGRDSGLSSFGPLVELPVLHHEGDAAQSRDVR